MWIFRIAALDVLQITCIFMFMALELNEANFEELVLKSDKPVLVDFWGEGCPPCKAIAPMIDQLADELVDEAVIGKVDVHQNQALAVKYGVRSIPFLLFIKDGEVKDNIMGSKVTKDGLKEKLQSL